MKRTYAHTSSIHTYTLNNIKAVRDNQTGCDYKCAQTIERVYWRRVNECNSEIIGGEVIAFILNDGEIFSIDRVEAVEWIDIDGTSYWIEPAEYVGHHNLPDDFDETWGKYPDKIRQSLDLLENEIFA